MHAALKLGVNVDHVATLRAARGTAYPSPLEAARLCGEAGAHGITIHLREDRRHIRDEDVPAMIREQDLPVNLEMANAPEIVEIALRNAPDEVCLVPERRQELTTEGGLDVAGRQPALRDTVDRLKAGGIRVSLFVDPDPRQLDAAHELGAPCVELHTGAYCDAAPDRRAAELEQLVIGARHAHALGLQVNAGHGLTVDNLPGLLEVPFLDTLNIGHSIVSRAVLIGMREAVREMLKAMQVYTGGRTS